VAETALTEGRVASPLRAWLYLVSLCLQRQARARQMVWVALALLGLTATVIELNTLADRWGMARWRMPRGYGLTYAQWLELTTVLPFAPPAASFQAAYAAASRVLLDRSGFFVFSNWIVFSVFLSFLLPIWSLSFATDALGGEREGRTLIWLLTQPLPRPAIYLAKFVALLPYSLALNLGGFALLCAAAGAAGWPAFELFWPAVACGTLAFCALFHLMGACFRRPAVVAIVYSFFLETILGNMPGYMKRVSIGFYVRCMMFEQAQSYGIQPEKPSIYLPVDSQTAAGVLLGAALASIVLGMLIFSRSEYYDIA
jgi:ABC-type transport system involved in multi-copper enzyme maturation permease subunit